MTSVQSILKEQGPRLSSEIVSLLVERDGISNEAARQRISRARSPVKRLGGISLPNRESFLFLDGDFGSENFYRSLVDAFKATKSAYGQALTGLQSRGSIIRKDYFPIATGLCTFPTKGHLLHDAVEEKLLNLGALYTQDTPEGQMIGLRGQVELSKKRKAILIAESIVLSSMRSWLTKTGMSSYQATKIRGDTLPSFGPFNWDLVGPSYLSGLVDYTKTEVKPGFIVGDIILDTVTIEDVSPFLAKCNVIKNQRTHRRFIPMFIADLYDNSALMELRRQGCLLARPETIFGEEEAKLIRELIRTIENAAAAIINDPSRVFEILKKLGKIEGASHNLRGVMLEFIVARLYSLTGYKIDIRQRIFAKGERAEIDIKAYRDDEVVCIECKGMSPGNLVDVDEVNDWLSSSLPTIKNWLKAADSLPNRKRFEFCVSTDFTDDAKTLIANIVATHKKQPIAFLNGSDLIERLREMNQSSIIEVFREHYV